MYTGNIGVAQNFGSLITTIKLLKEKIFFGYLLEAVDIKIHLFHKSIIIN